MCGLTRTEFTRRDDWSEVCILFCWRSILNLSAGVVAWLKLHYESMGCIVVPVYGG